MKLTTTNDTKLNYLRAIVYGDSGIGKTTSLKTLWRDNTLIAITERGAIPLRNEKFNALQIGCWKDLRTLIGWFAAPDAIEDKEAAKAIRGCRILAVDSLSDVAELCIRHILEVDRKILISQRTKGKSDTPENVYEDLMQMEDWGLLRKRMRALLSSFCHLPMHVIFTSLATWSKDKQDQSTYRTPALSGKLATECPAFFDLVLYMESRPTSNGETQRVWRTQNDGRIIAKDASGALDAFEAPDWKAVFTKILDTKKAETTK
jgi:hypothetical protein